jgi:hypothetical protein
MFTKYKEKYPVQWCNLCEVAIISCPICENASCNGSGCEECKNDFIEFTANKSHRIETYLTEDEIKLLHKFHSIKKHMIDTLSEGIMKIDWLELDKAGRLSQNDRDMFIK